MKRVKIRRVSMWSMVLTIVVGVLFFVISSWTNREFRVLQTTTEQYILCEKAATNLQDGSDYLTEQVRLYVMTGQQTYLDNYFEEANHTRRRENASGAGDRGLGPGQLARSDSSDHPVCRRRGPLLIWKAPPGPAVGVR